MLEVGNVGKKEQMYWEEIAPRNDAWASMSKDIRNGTILCTLEPVWFRDLDANLHKQMPNTLFKVYL